MVNWRQLIVLVLMEHCHQFVGSGTNTLDFFNRLFFHHINPPFIHIVLVDSKLDPTRCFQIRQ